MIAGHRGTASSSLRFPSLSSVFVYMISPKKAILGRLTPLEFTPVAARVRKFRSGVKSRNDIM